MIIVSSYKLKARLIELTGLFYLKTYKLIPEKDFIKLYTSQVIDIIIQGDQEKIFKKRMYKKLQVEY